MIDRELIAKIKDKKQKLESWEWGMWEYLLELNLPKED